MSELKAIRDHIRSVPGKGESAFIGFGLPAPMMTELWNLRQVSREDAPKLLDAVMRVQELATYFETLAEGDKHYAKLIRDAIGKAIK